MKWLTNMYNPTLPDAKERVWLLDGETQDEAWEKQEQYVGVYFPNEKIGRKEAVMTVEEKLVDMLYNYGLFKPQKLGLGQCLRSR